MEVISLNSLLESSEEESVVREYLSSFTCGKNTDVESFLHNKAIEHENRSLARTSLVVDEGNNYDIIGYFTLLNKNFDFTNASGSTRKKLTGNKSASSFSTILIGQLGRSDKYKGEVAGKIILNLALENCKKINLLVATKVVSVEFEDQPKLFEFYEENDFKLLQKNENGYFISYVKI
ncbi:hypothetical protein MHI57_10675 [Cytobacillus sp. FSL K6-0129]|uniref:hypothetical protein n=1 Tax=Cytobacillus sp. FSL K6-0129 TaxID=2921421 RepID=UPI0030F5F9F5